MDAGGDRMGVHVVLTRGGAIEDAPELLLGALESAIAEELAEYDLPGAVASYRLLQRIEQEECYRRAAWLSLLALIDNPNLARMPDIVATVTRR